MEGPIPRELSLLIAFPIFVIIAVILGILILRRDPNYWGNRLFFLAFILNALALIFNLVYLFDASLIIPLNKASITSINYALICMILAILVLLKGEKEVIANKNTYGFILTATIIIVIHLILPGGIEPYSTPGGIVPRWSLLFGIYQIIFSQALFIFLMYYAIRLYKEISPEMQHKFKRFLIGGFFVDLTFLSISINNMYIIPGYDSIANLFNLGAFIGIILIYYGIVRRD